MVYNQPGKIQQGQMQSPAFGMEQSLVQIQNGECLLKLQYYRKAPGKPYTNQQCAL